MQLLQRPFAGVEKHISRGRLERGIVQFRRLHFVFLEANFFQDGSLGGFKQGVEAPKDNHRQDDIAVFTPDEDIAQGVVGDGPDEVGDPVELSLVHE